jgi:hypothetical protein
MIDMETDPTGRCAKEPGAKLDEGKVMAGLMVEGFARALWAVAEVSTYGANKYSYRGWEKVPDGQKRYFDAQMRHTLCESMGERNDKATGLTHAAHEAWNALARLELMLREDCFKKGGFYEDLQDKRHGVCGEEDVDTESPIPPSKRVPKSKENQDSAGSYRGFASDYLYGERRMGGVSTQEMGDKPCDFDDFKIEDCAGVRCNACDRMPKRILPVIKFD